MANEIWTVGRILKWTEQYFQEKGIETARLDGEVLLSHMLNKERIYCYSHYDQPLTKDELTRYKELLNQRIAGKSVAAIVGKKEFMGLEFKVNEDVLIPRADTETLVEGVLNLLDRNSELNILDVCLGSGAILLSNLNYMPKAKGIGLELSEKAIAIAKINAKELGLEGRATILKSDLFSALADDEYGGEFDLITSNPPYIPSQDMKVLAKEVLREPHMALDGGATGLDFYKPIIEDGAKYLKSDGWMVLEFGIGQEKDITAIAENTDLYKNIQTWVDLGGIIRVIAMQRK